MFYAFVISEQCVYYNYDSELQYDIAMIKVTE